MYKCNTIYFQKKKYVNMSIPISECVESTYTERMLPKVLRGHGF